MKFIFIFNKKNYVIIFFIYFFLFKSTILLIKVRYFISKYFKYSI